ncbi:hypothetical protein Vadar_006214 [Vaccinium darrowii]|uniref:Uncharacterized protein n=1 Tax=Vaccinium darrowii TaxID=229202 RepID=A0ACB7XFT3_9ERIC|nr:hypothetical protein Vadar_006214 [Vaccinium darrowii]
MWVFGRKGPSGFSASSTAEEVTKGIDGTGLTAIVTGLVICLCVFQNNPDSLIVQATEEGKDWLDRSAVGWLPSLRSVESLMDAFIVEGIYNIQLRDMGGKLVLLTFASVEDMTSMLEEAGLCWLRNWFEDVKRWSPNLKLDNKRADCVNKDRGFRSSVVEDSEDYESALEKGEDVDVSGNKEDTFAIANKDDQAKLSTPSSINQISESSIHVEEYKEASQAREILSRTLQALIFLPFPVKMWCRLAMRHQAVSVFKMLKWILCSLALPSLLLMTRFR